MKIYSREFFRIDKIHTSSYSRSLVTVKRNKNASIPRFMGLDIQSIIDKEKIFKAIKKGKMD